MAEATRRPSRWPVVAPDTAGASNGLFGLLIEVLEVIVH